MVLVTGGREYNDVGTVFDCLTHLDSEFQRMIVIHGDAAGADTLAYDVCRDVGIEQCRIPACWKKYNRAAGPIRNRLMLDLFPNLDLVLTFPGGLGTANMKEQAQERKIQVVDSQDLMTVIRQGQDRGKSQK